MCHLCLPSACPGRSYIFIHGTRQLQEIEGMEVVLVRSKEPRGVLMVFHGCMRRPTDWWHYESTCGTCIGKGTHTPVGTCTPGLVYVQKRCVLLAWCSQGAMHVFCPSSVTSMAA